MVLRKSRVKKSRSRCRHGRKKSMRRGCKKRSGPKRQSRKKSRRRVRRSNKKSARRVRRSTKKYKYNMDCQRGIFDRRNCLHPLYPCWVSKKLACYDKEGSTQLFDPIADILRPVSHLFNYIINRTADINQDQSNELYQLMNNYMTSFAPIQNIVLGALDNARYHDIQAYLSNAQQIGRQLINSIRRIG